MKSKTTTTALAFFFGGFGIHRFYLGQTGLGFLYLIFCWTFIPAIIAFIDFLVFIFVSQKTFDEEYNEEELKKQAKKEKQEKEDEERRQQQNLLMAKLLKDK